MKRWLLVFTILVVVAGALATWRWHDSAKPATKSHTISTNQPAAQVQRQPAFNKRQYSLTDPTSIWVVVNKKRPLNPKNYVPADLVVPSVPLRVPGNESMQLRQTTAAAIETMFAAAKKQGINLMLSSGYRSYSYQVALYGSYVKSSGQAAADQFSARPGYSEHQTGLAADIEPTSEKCDVNQCFGDLPEGKWLAANSYKYGFIIRYPGDGQAITGYEPEPWHVRYIGIAASTEMHNEGVSTLEQFFDLPSAPNY